MAKVPCSTLHVPHTPARATGQAGSQVGRIRLLLAGSCLHVARVPSRAAVLAVLTAHSLGGTRRRLPLSATRPPARGGLGSSPGQAGGHSHEATGSRPSPHSGLGSRSAPQGSWCAGHSPCLCDETGQPGGQASSAVQSPSCSTSDTAPQPSMCSHGGSSARGLSSRQPWGRGRQHRVVWEAAMWGGKLSPCLPRLPFLLTALPARNEPNGADGPPAGQAEDGGAKQQESDHPPRPRHYRPPSHAPPTPPRTSGAGQQPHSPDASRQQVLEEGQLVMLSQGTLCSMALAFDR